VSATREALYLRAAALSVLADREPDWPRLKQCSASTWQVFCRTERCALALKTHLAAAGFAVPDRVRAKIEQAATRELQRILSARSQLLRIGQLAAAHGIPAIVLKGGVAALASDAPVDLHDVDVLVPPLEAERLAALLDRDGFHATGPASAAHLAQRVSPNGVQIEVHFALNDIEVNDAMWSRARPVHGAAGLSRLGRADHVWHLLVHSVVTHAHRRGSLRDVLLVADALRDCSPTELDEVEGRSASHRFARALGGVLAMARELGAGARVRDRFRREAAANYLLRGPLAWLGSSRFWTSAFLRALFALLEGAADRQREWTLAWSRSQVPSVWGWPDRLERRAPRLGSWCRSAARVMRLIVCRVAAWPVALAARVLAAR
jgi:putative nucleotidyltransferase-like protein